MIRAAGLRRHLRPGVRLLAGGEFQPGQVAAVQLSQRVPSHQCALEGRLLISILVLVFPWFFLEEVIIEG